MDTAKQTRTGPEWRTRAAATLLRRLLDSWGATWRWEASAVEAGRSACAQIDAGGPVIFACWHQSILPFTLWLRRFVLPHHPLAALSSASKDGELGAHVGIGWGARIARGSSSRGGAAGARALARLIRDGDSAVLLVDGPRGPAFEAKPGVVLLARLTGAPIFAVRPVTHRAKRLRSWDRMILPRPFSRVGIELSEPLPVAKGDDLEEARRRLERVLGT